MDTRGVLTHLCIYPWGGPARGRSPPAPQALRDTTLPPLRHRSPIASYSGGAGSPDRPGPPRPARPAPEPRSWPGSGRRDGEGGPGSRMGIGPAPCPARRGHSPSVWIPSGCRSPGKRAGLGSVTEGGCLGCWGPLLLPGTLPGARAPWLLPVFRTVSALAAVGLRAHSEESLGHPGRAACVQGAPRAMTPGRRQPATHLLSCSGLVGWKVEFSVHLPAAAVVCNPEPVSLHFPVASARLPGGSCLLDRADITRRCPCPWAHIIFFMPDFQHHRQSHHTQNAQIITNREVDIQSVLAPDWQPVPKANIFETPKEFNVSVNTENLQSHNRQGTQSKFSLEN